DPIELTILGRKVKSTPAPVKINDKPGYEEVGGVDKRPVFKGKEDIILQALKKIRPLFEQLPDGTYEINAVNSVVAPTGKLIHFDFGKIRQIGSADKMKIYSSPIQSFDKTNAGIAPFLQAFIDSKGLNASGDTANKLKTNTSPEYNSLVQNIYNSLYRELLS